MPAPPAAACAHLGPSPAPRPQLQPLSPCSHSSISPAPGVASVPACAGNMAEGSRTPAVPPRQSVPRVSEPPSPVSVLLLWFRLPPFHGVWAWPPCPSSTGLPRGTRPCGPLPPRPPSALSPSSGPSVVLRGLLAAVCHARPVVLTAGGPREPAHWTEDQKRHVSRAGALTQTNQTSFILPLPCVWEMLNFFSFKILFSRTWCLLLLLPTAELACWNPPWPVSLCILLRRYVQIGTCVHAYVTLAGLLGLTQRRWISLVRH